MKNVTIEELEKVKRSYSEQLQETHSRILMLEGAIQATDNIIKLMKEEVKLDTTPSASS